jgi:hypothetical protein
VKLREQAGATAYLPFARLAVAEVLEARGRIPDAIAEARRAARDGASSGSRRGEAMALVALTRLLRAEGDAAGAAEAAAGAVAAARAFGDPELLAEAERTAGAGG